jgi:hypothetical protein
MVQNWSLGEERIWTKRATECIISQTSALREKYLGEDFRPEDPGTSTSRDSKGSGG